MTISLTDTLSNTIYNVPLTLSFAAPEAWTTVTATQNGSPLSASLSNGTVYVDAVPDAGSIEVTGTSGGSEPTAPQFENIVFSGADLELSFPSENGVNYQLQRATVGLDTLTEDDWVSLGNPEASTTGDGSVVLLSDPAATSNFDSA